MHELYLEVFSQADENGICLAPVETVVSLFTYTFCNHPFLFVTFVVTSDQKHRPGLKVKLPDVIFEFIDESEMYGVAANCKLPVFVLRDRVSATAGLCAVLRLLIKFLSLEHPLLGFKQSCLYACAETSLWTKFCEVDIINTVNGLYEKKNWTSEKVEIPYDVARFEVHMRQPVKIHNIQKEKQDLARSKGHRKLGLPDSRLAPLQELEHMYSEGHKMTLADVMLLPSFHIIFQFLGSVFLKQHLPLSYQWYENMLSVRNVQNGLKVMVDLQKKFDKEIYVNYLVPDVGKESLYKGEVKKNGANRHLFTRQEDIFECFEKVDEIRDVVQMEETTFGEEIDFDWKTVPSEEGLIPAKRLERKGLQLQNMTKAVLKIAKNGDRIVDFCSGSGHLGVILAHALPRCSVVLLENKEQSLSRAKERAGKLSLSNIFFCQSNVDYFRGKFNIGVSLHACGVATDLVMERCIQENAAFVCCPCCYGSIQSNHMVWYPRSLAFRKSRLSLKEYLILAHASDQTHYDDNPKTSQGNKCMAIIDSDRCLRAKEAGYRVFLSKFEPPSCTPKNNLLVGVPREAEAEAEEEKEKEKEVEAEAEVLYEPTPDATDESAFEIENFSDKLCVSPKNCDEKSEL